MSQLFANNATSVLANAISASATSLTLATGGGAKFPLPVNGDFFLLTLFQLAGATEVNFEVVKCTGRTGDVFTIVRGQEGTAAQAYNGADFVQLRLTAGTLATLGGASVLLAKLTPTVATIIDAVTIFNSSYDNYQIIGSGLTCAVGDQLCFRFASAGVVDAGANYAFRDTTAGSAILTPGANQVTMGAYIDPVSNGCSFSMQILNANDTRLKAVQSVLIGQSGNLNANSVNAAYTVASSISGIRFFWLGGSNFGATGTIRIYGIKNS